MVKRKKLKRKVQSHPTNSLATSPSPTPEEQRKILREAQNVNRGHPRKGETREELRQINVSCLASIGEQFTDLSLKTGRTKRVLLEEAITHLVRKYDQRRGGEKGYMQVSEMIGGGERAGSGADTIKKGWADNKWPVPEIKEHFGQNDDRVELTLRISQIADSPTNQGGAGRKQGENRKKTGKEIRFEIKEIIRENPEVSITMLARTIGVTPKSVEWHISKMRGTELLHEGPDKGGHWVILE